ncbi:MAG: hypothetical protein GXP47_09495 [Acidobacteria bacterium]|nr:hypothetical protein [Acidobacteriota bacterium]
MSRPKRPVRSILLAAVVMTTVVWLAWQAPPLQAGTGATVPILVQGQVTLQRPNAPAPDPSWAVPLMVTFHTPGDSSPAYAWLVTTDDSGKFSIVDSVEEAIYDVRVKNLHTLRNLKQNVPIVAGTNTLDLGTLREGDASDDNRVNIADFAILRAAYFTQEGEAGFDPRTDFDEDNRINVRDFALLRSNYFSEGDIIVPRAPARPPAHSTTLYLRPAVVRTEVDITRPVRAYLDARGGQIVGADVVIAFDPALLQIVDATGTPTTTVIPGDALDVVLMNRVDNSQGRIKFGAGTFGDPFAAQGTLFSFYIRALTETFGTPLDIVYADVVDTVGQSVTTNLESGRLQAGNYHYAQFPATWGRWSNLPPLRRFFFPVLK